MPFIKLQLEICMPALLQVARRILLSLFICLLESVPMVVWPQLHNTDNKTTFGHMVLSY